MRSPRKETWAAERDWDGELSGCWCPSGEGGRPKERRMRRREDGGDGLHVLLRLYDAGVVLGRKERSPW